MNGKQRWFVCWLLLCVLATIQGEAVIAALPPDPAGARWAPLAHSGAALAPAAAGNAGGPVGSAFVIGNAAVDLRDSAVAYNSRQREYAVVWATAVGDIYGARLRYDGRLIGTYPVETGGGITRSHPDIAYNLQDNDYYVVWQHDNGSRVTVRGLPFNPGGPAYLSSDLKTGATLKDCFEPVVDYASSAYKFMVVWERHVVGSLSSDIEAQVLTGGGALEGSNFIVKSGVINHSYSQPDIAYNRSRNEYLIVWTWHDMASPNYDILGRIVTRNGELLGADLVLGYHTPSEWAPSVAAMPTVANYGGYLVAWELRYTATDGDIYSRTVPGRIVEDSGTSLGNVVIVTSSGEDSVRPAVAANDLHDRFLVTWTEKYASPFINVGIRGQEMTLTGALWGAAGWPGGLFADNAAVAAGPTGDFLVTFQDSTLFSNVDIYGRLWGRRVYLPLTLRN